MNIGKFVQKGLAAQAAVDSVLATFKPDSGPPPLPEKKERKKILLSQCRVTWEGDFYLVIGPGKTGLLWREHRNLCYMSVAYSRLSGANLEASWKTFDLLVTFRQAIRECYAQGMPLEIPLMGAGKNQVMKFLRSARVYDTVHHGQPTF